MNQAGRGTPASQEDAYTSAYAARDFRTGAVMANPMPPEGGQPQKGRGGRIAIIVILCILAAIALIGISCSAAIGSMKDVLSGDAGGSSVVKASAPSAVVIDIDSTIDYNGSACSPEGLDSRLSAARADDMVKGVILRVNSGGGTATAGEEMAQLVADFPKPVVVVSAATNASAAYEISSQADYIFCAKTSSVGAIGVALQVTDLSGLYEKLGIDIDTIVSADSKDAGYGNRPLTDEEREWYQSMVDEIDADFVQTVADGRGMTIAEVKALANGLPYTGSQAVENGLADEIGYFDDALSYLSGLVGEPKGLDIISYEPSTSSLDMLLSLLGSSEYKGSIGASSAPALS